MSFDPINPGFSGLSLLARAQSNADHIARIGSMITPTLQDANARPMLGGGSVQSAESSLRLLGGPTVTLIVGNGRGVVLDSFG